MDEKYWRRYLKHAKDFSYIYWNQNSVNEITLMKRLLNIKMLLDCRLGCPDFPKSWQIIWSKKYVIIDGKLKHYLNFQSFPSLFSIPKLHLKYTKEILKKYKGKYRSVGFFASLGRVKIPTCFDSGVSFEFLRK